MTRIGTHW